jgi:hypothetical protein
MIMLNVLSGVSVPQTITDEEIKTISSQIYAAGESNRITGDDLVYNVEGPK